jgi:hypothetical protein
MFGNDSDKSSKLDFLNDAPVETKKKTVNLTPSQSALQSTSGRGANVGSQSHKDDQLNDLILKVEKEDDLDFDTFGKSIASATGNRKAAESNKNKILGELYNEDFDLSALNQLDALERSTTNKKKNTPIVTSQKSVAQSTETVVDIDLANLDINSYINDNQSGGGGLFD